MRKDIQRAIKEANKKKMIYIYSISFSAILLISAIAFMVYVGNLSNNNDTFPEIKGLADGSKDITYTEEASSEIGKSIDQVKKDENEKNTNEKILLVENNTVTTNDKLKEPEEIQETQNIKSVSNQNTEEKITNKEDEEKNINPIFAMPVEGEIIKEFAKDKLVYSDTLKEWVTHTGIDIKAEKTSIVKAAEKGSIKSIKNDPRYGLTVVIEHNMRI